MDKNRYRSSALAWLGALAGLIFICHFLLPGLHMAIGKLLGLFLAKPLYVTRQAFLEMDLIYIPGVYIIMIGIAWTTLQRLHWLNIGYGWSLAVILWLIGAITFFPRFEFFLYRPGETMERLVSYPSVLLFFLLFFMGFLAFKKKGQSYSYVKGNSLPWWIAAFSAGHAIVLLLPTIVKGLHAVPVLGILFKPIIGVIQILLALFELDGILAMGFSRNALAFVDFFIFALALSQILSNEGLNDYEPAPDPRQRSGKLREERPAHSSSSVPGTPPHPRGTFRDNLVKDNAFWPAIAASVFFVLFALAEMSGRTPSGIGNRVIEYVDANGEPLSAERIERIKRANKE